MAGGYGQPTAGLCPGAFAKSCPADSQGLLTLQEKLRGLLYQFSAGKRGLPIIPADLAGTVECKFLLAAVAVCRLPEQGQLRPIGLLLTLQWRRSA